jgi:hypothetical protein
MSYELTKNFEKELNLFFSWVNQYYLVENDLNDIVEWSKELLTEFNETPRKKLDGFLKHVFKIYIIKNKENNDVIDSYTDLVAQFKDTKDDYKNDYKNDFEISEKKKNKEYKDNNGGNNGRKIKNKTACDDDSDDDYEISLEDLNKNPYADDNIIDMEIVINHELNTKNTWWLTNLVYDTDTLLNIFGEPVLTGNENDKHRYEWKFECNNKIYSIYDWKFNNTEFCDFKDAKWFLGGNDDRYVYDIVDILDYKISQTVNSIPIVHVTL